MCRLRPLRRLTAWIAVLGILLAALVPSVSLALGSNDGASWVEVCTAQGAKWIAAGNDDGPSERSHTAEHCPYCSFHAQSAGLPPSPPAVILSTALADVLPKAFLAAPRTPHAWVRAQPRAPPLLA